MLIPIDVGAGLEANCQQLSGHFEWEESEEASEEKPS